MWDPSPTVRGRPFPGRGAALLPPAAVPSPVPVQDPSRRVGPQGLLTPSDPCRVAQELLFPASLARRWRRGPQWGSMALSMARQQLSPGPFKLFLQKLSNSFIIVLRQCCFKVRSNLSFFLSGHSSFPPVRSFMPLPGPCRILYHICL